MFLIRSAFWLTIAFIALNPHHVDLGASASQLGGEALATGQRLVVSQLLRPDCPLLHCAEAKPATTPVVAHAPAPAPAAAVHSVKLQQPIPFPQPRPARLG